jgi:hypothetical protein
LKAVDSNAAIIGTLKDAMDTLVLAQGWQKGAMPTNNLGMAHTK